VESLQEFINEECCLDGEDPARNTTPGYETIEELSCDEGKLVVVRGYGFARGAVTVYGLLATV